MGASEVGAIGLGAIEPGAIEQGATGAPATEASAIRTRIKEIIAQVSGIAVDEIGDDALLVDDLDLDSLSMMEIGVDVDYTYRLGLPDEQLHEIRSVQDAVDLVLRELASRAAA